MAFYTAEDVLRAIVPVIKTQGAEEFSSQCLERTRLLLQKIPNMDPEELRSFFTAEAAMIGPLSTQNIVHGLTKFYEGLELYRRSQLSLTDSSVALVHATDKTSLVIGTYLLTVSHSGKFMFSVHQRFSLFFVKGHKGPVIAHAHVSDPDNLNEDGEDFPYLVGSKLKSMLTKLKFKAQRDELTGICSRNYLESNRMRFAERLNEEGALVIFIDLNGFKEVNDREGHAAGDVILSSMGRVLRDCLDDKAPGAELMRLGGDEFLVIIFGADFPELGAVLRDLKRRFFQKFPRHVPEISYSVGFAFSRPNMSFKELINLADLRMYRVKHFLKDSRGRE